MYHVRSCIEILKRILYPYIIYKYLSIYIAYLYLDQIKTQNIIYYQASRILQCSVLLIHAMYAMVNFHIYDS